MILSTSSLALPEGSPLRREMPRLPEHRQPGYEAAYDGQTLFYDVYRHGDRIVLSGPPLLNLHVPLRAARFSSGARALTAHFSDLNRTQRSSLQGSASSDVAIAMDGLNATMAISPDGRDLFNGRRVLTTLSRNNRLEWIVDWIAFYARVHEIDAVLFYDNASDAYDIGSIESAISAIPGIEVVVVVSWPFPYGPGAGANKVWDSDYCQAGMLEHARFRFLEKAAQVINADVDELVVTEDGRPLHRHLAEAGKGGLMYPGRWVEGIPPQGTPRFTDFDAYDPTQPACPAKWSVRPSAVLPEAQWGTHGFVGWWPDRPSGVYYGHYRLISTNWKYARAARKGGEGLVGDEVLRRALTRAFG